MKSDADDRTNEPVPTFFAGGGAMGGLMRAHDWAATPLGEPAAWPQPLQTLIGVMLSANQPMFVAWGAARLLLYNDSYVPMLADRHPGALGRPFLDVWSEARAELTPLLDQVFAGEPVQMDDIELLLDRPGRPREAHFAFSYTPVRDGAGTVIGLFCACAETTEQVMAAREKAGAAERQRAIFQQMPGFVAVLSGPCHVFDYVNDAYVAISGERDFIGRGVRDVFPDIAGQGFYELLDQAYASGEPFTARALPIALERDDGERFIDLIYQPVRDGAGEVAGIFVGGYDVTDQVRAQRRLRASEERYRTLFEAIDAGFCIIEMVPDAQGRLTDYRMLEVNPAFERQSGLRNAVGRTVREFVPDHEDFWFDLYGRVATTGAPARTESGSAALDRWWDVHAFRVGEPEQRRVAVLFNDVSKRRRAELHLRELNETLERRVADALAERKLLVDIVEGTDAFVQVADLDYRWLAVNRAAANEFEAIYGVRPKVGENMLETLAGHPEHQAEVRAVWSRALGGEEFTQVGAFGDPGRDRRHYEMKYNVLRDAEGTRIGAYQFVYDVSGRVRDQQRLAEAEEQLRQSQKMEAVGQLTGGIAHDFNNLLTGVIGSLDMMQRRIARGEIDTVERYATTAMTAANRAAALTHRLLAFSRRQPLDPRPVNANRLVTGTEELLRRTIGESVRLEIVTAGGLWQTRCDPHQLESAVLNLAINARDAMPGGGALTIETCNAHLDSAYAARSRDVRPGQYVCICVTDTGTGMTPEVIAKAFDPFFTTKPIGQGTGLGLSMIYGFARQSEGYARIYSEPGHGTTVKLYLPRYYGEAEDEEQPQGALTDAHRTEHGEVVLVVEDEAAVRDLVVDVLQELGYRAVEAADGPSGLKLLQSDMQVDLLVTDIGLPGLNGRELADQARARRPDLRVLFMTGYAENAAVANGFLDPGMAMITKPFAVEALATRIRDMIEDRSRER